MFNLILLLFFSLLLNNTISKRIGVEKYWLPNLEYSTKNNWINNNLPLKNSRIRFPLDLEHSVGLPLINADLIFSGIELSRDGSLLLPFSGKIQFSNSIIKDSEINKINIFKWKWNGSFFWLDPQNWSGSNNAVPHLERIPCSTDTVYLPNKNHSLSIKLPNVNVYVKEIKIINETLLEEWDWQDAMKGREFQQSRWSVKYSGLQYCHTDNCLCHHKNNVDELIKEICKIQYPRCSSETLCEYPLKVEGHCCSYCGGRISLKNTASLSTIDEISNEALKIYNNKILYHVRITDDENIEVLVTENDIYYGLKSQEAIDTLHNIFSEKGFIILNYAVTGAPLTKTIIGSILGPIFGIPLIIILLILVGIPYFGYSYRDIFAVFQECSSIHEGSRPNTNDPTSKSGNFEFARFENIPEGDVQLASAVISDDEIDDDDEHGGKRFENPLYRSKRREQTQNIINIDEPVSLTDLQGRIDPTEETYIDSD